MDRRKCDTETEVEDAAPGVVRHGTLVTCIYIGVIGVKVFEVVSVPHSYSHRKKHKHHTHIYISPTHYRKNEHVQPPSRAQDPVRLSSTPRPERRCQGFSPVSRWHVPRFQMGR